MNLVPLFEEAIEFQNYNGSVLSNGKVAVFYIGRTRLADIFNDIEGLSPAENPKVLDNLGMGPLYVNPAFDYELIVYDAYDNELFSVKKYLHSKGEHSTANVVVTPSENIAVSAWTIGDVQVYMPYLTGDIGKTYEGIDPIVVNNEYNRISANHIPLGVQDPLYFVEDSESACIIGMSGGTVPEGTMTESGLGFENGKITGYNGSAFSAGNEYVAGSYVDITDNTISVTGLQPEGDYAYNSALSSKLDVTALPQDLVHNGDLTAYQPAGNYQTAGNYLSATDSAKFYPMEGNPSGYINELPSDLATTGFVADVSANITAIIPTGDSNTISYNAKPTDKPIYASANKLINVNSIQGKNDLAIIPYSILEVPHIITAIKGDLLVENAISAVNGRYFAVENAISAVPNSTLNVPGVITTNPLGLTAAGLSANTNYGLSANGLTADAHIGFSAIGISAGKQGPLSIEGQYESIYASEHSGFTFSSQNTAFGTAQLGIANGNSVVQMYAPKFEAKNVSGAGFSIEASGAKGYDESGNVVWDTQNPQVKNIICYNDTLTATGGLTGSIILTVMPSTNASNLTSAPYVIMDASQASYFASYGPSAQTPTVSLMPDSIRFEYPVDNSGRTTVGYYDIKQEASGSAWTLTGSIQKRELEYDANTSAITAIAGSAIGGQGGGELPESVSAATDYVTANSANIDATVSNVSANSGAWGGSALPISAGQGVNLSVSDDKLVIRVVPTALYTVRISDIILTASLPVSPDANTLYLIQE